MAIARPIRPHAMVSKMNFRMDLRVMGFFCFFEGFLHPETPPSVGRARGWVWVGWEELLM
jgi:hypothetical protein